MRKIDASALIDGARFNAFHARVLFWCALIIIFDGYDLVIYGVVLPSLMAEWDLTALQAGALGSCALVGMMLGALFFGSLSDRIGRRKTIMMCVLLFSGVTALNGFASTPETFALCRFIAGLGIGGVMPNVVALMNEYAPRKSRSTLVAIMFSGYSLGGMLSAGLGMIFIPLWGWQAVFYVALIPLLLTPLLIKQLPESMDFLLRSGQLERARLLLAKATPAYAPEPDDLLIHNVSQGTKASMGELFRDGRTISTLALWVAFFCCLLMVYALSSWLPKIMSSAGYGLNSSLAFLFVLNTGAIVGAIGGGWLGDRVGIAKVLLFFFACGALSLSLLAVKAPLMMLYLLIAIAGLHNRHSDSGERLRRSILPATCPFHRFGVGDGDRPHRGNHRARALRCITRIKLATAGQFPGICRSGRHWCSGYPDISQASNGTVARRNPATTQ
ncbi:4-hydroxybenzoate transporter PcaK [Pseudomonas sp. 37 R 15]|nr:4-hydroxybenzoate transporter PcaK [Pseudomonas sp. 37 R 15]